MATMRFNGETHVVDPGPQGSTNWTDIGCFKFACYMNPVEQQFSTEILHVLNTSPIPQMLGILGTDGQWEWMEVEAKKECQITPSLGGALLWGNNASLVAIDLA